MLSLLESELELPPRWGGTKPERAPAAQITAGSHDYS